MRKLKLRPNGERWQIGVELSDPGAPRTIWYQGDYKTRTGAIRAAEKRANLGKADLVD